VTTAGRSFTPSVAIGGGATGTTQTVNFGQGGQTGLTYDAASGGRFKYTPPAGFKALCTANLPAPVIKNASQYFNVVLYTGDGTANRTITDVGFNPDLVWEKGRSYAGGGDHYLVDSIRGAAYLESDAISPESVAANTTYGALGGVTTNGFLLSSGSTSSANVNQNGSTYVAWCWKGGGNAVTNNTGTVQSQVSANTTAGFSIVTATTPSSGTTFSIGHGLNAVPSFIIGKTRQATSSWWVYHQSIGAGKFLALQDAGIPTSNTDVWANTTPTSSVMYQNYAWNGQVNNLILYLWAEVPGFSRFGSYKGNGSADGPFVYCGFKPRWIMVKDISVGDAGSSWVVWDTIRTPYNVMDGILAANLNIAEQVGAGNISDMLSNGFKLRTTSTSVNGVRTYIFAAFAEASFKYANAR
jgi:hypothetical protein